MIFCSCFYFFNKQSRSFEDWKNKQTKNYKEFSPQVIFEQRRRKNKQQLKSEHLRKMGFSQKKYEEIKLTQNQNSAIVLIQGNTN